MSLRILGINAGSYSNPKKGPHNSSAALIEDGEVITAVEEERFSRIKQDVQYPLQAIDYALQGTMPERVTLAWLNRIKQSPLLSKVFTHIRDEAKDDPELNSFYWKQQPSRFSRLFYWRRTIAPILRGISRSDVEHHYAHAASAYYCSPWGDEKMAVITLDGQGDFSCGSVWLGEKGKLTNVDYFDELNSVGHIYSAVTYHLGFSPNRHEGKIVGLAAYGNPDLFYDRLMQYCRSGNWHRLFEAALIRVILRPYRPLGQNILKQLCKGLSREDIAAGLQKFSEVIVQDLTRHYVQKLGVSKVALAGGVFSNVKLNQRILELPEVDNVYIHPNMGDGGLAVGAALAAYAETQGGMTPKFMKSAYLGPDIPDEEAMAELEKAGLKFSRPDDLAEQAAELLASGKVVARAAGRMEYGPRALGNRTLFASCSDPDINKWLNDKLQRTEFMPFAPIIMEEHAKEYFPAWEPDHVAARFMTITYDASEIAKKNIPAAIHVDGTARPQVLRQEDNPQVYAMLKAYHARTGVPALINTSFNMHEEPIVCSAFDAIRAFQLGHLDALIVGNCLTLAGLTRTGEDS